MLSYHNFVVIYHKIVIGNDNLKSVLHPLHQIYKLADDSQKLLSFLITVRLTRSFSMFSISTTVKRMRKTKGTNTVLRKIERTIFVSSALNACQAFDIIFVKALLMDTP